MEDVDIGEFLRLIPSRHIVIALLGAIPLALGLMGYFSTPEEGVLAWTGDYAGPLMIFGALMGVPLYYACARGGLAMRDRSESGAE